mmetsp:Transcript_1999/g.5975  ORF Transcript_1999/g.5975 Transcript_1999/m.5975 type:complete len:711 (+) Transcript_1999:452-2584(+)
MYARRSQPQLSSRFEPTGAVGVRSREAGNINQSLLTLGRVISALVDRQPHVPYRDSKLTRLLQESLGGRNKTLIIATCSPASRDLEESASTIEYSHRAKSIRNKPSVNVMVSKKERMLELTQENSRLRNELDTMRSKDGVYLPSEQFATMQAELDSHKERLDYLQKLVQEKEQINDNMLAAMEEAGEERDKALDAANAAQNSLQIAARELSLERDAHAQAVSVAHARFNNERALTAQLNTVHALLKRADSDAESLEGIVRRKCRLEETNSSAVKELEGTLSGLVAGLAEQIKEVTTIQSQESLRAVEEMDAFTSAHTKGVHSMSEELKRLWESVERCVADSQRQMDQFVAEAQSRRTGVESQVLDCCDKAEKLVSNGISATRDAVLAMGNHISACSAAVIQFRKSSINRRQLESYNLTSACSAVLNDVAELDRAVKEEVQSQRAELSALQARLGTNARCRNDKLTAWRDSLLSNVQDSIRDLSAHYNGAAHLVITKFEDGVCDLGAQMKRDGASLVEDLKEQSQRAVRDIEQTAEHRTRLADCTEQSGQAVEAAAAQVLADATSLESSGLSGSDRLHGLRTNLESLERDERRRGKIAELLESRALLTGGAADAARWRELMAAQNRNWTFPRTLTRTPDHSALLETFRDKNGPGDENADKENSDWNALVPQLPLKPGKEQARRPEPEEGTPFLQDAKRPASRIPRPRSCVK